MFRRMPVKKLSTQSTSHSWLSIRAHRCEPRKPAPPVTKTRFFTMRLLPLRVRLHVRRSERARARDILTDFGDDQQPRRWIAAKRIWDIGCITPYSDGSTPEERDDSPCFSATQRTQRIVWTRR